MVTNTILTMPKLFNGVPSN